MKNSLLIPLIAVSIIALFTGSSLGGVLIIRQQRYSQLYSEYQELLEEYTVLIGDYEQTEMNYNTLLATYNDLSNQLAAFKNYVSTLILPMQYSVFAEKVRRHYMPLYLSGLIGKSYWVAFAEYCRDVIFHDSWQRNEFTVVSNAFSECLKFGANTMYLADYIMYNTFWDWLPNWRGYGLYGSECSKIDTVVDWCVDEIDYEYDTDITVGQTSFIYDYIKFPVETAFRTLGDCEDQAILLAAYLESCGFQTAIAISHDDNHPTYGQFYHGSLLVHIEDTGAFGWLHPFTSLWRLGSNDPYYPDYTWCWLDPTWDVRFGSKVPWLNGYTVTSAVVTIAICDVGGYIL